MFRRLENQVELRTGDQVQFADERSVFRDGIGTITAIDRAKRCLTVEIVVFDRPNSLELDFETAARILKRVNN